jgi:hypothetical protein
MNAGVVSAGWIAFGVFLVLLAVRSVLSELYRDPIGRPWTVMHRLDLATGLVSAALVGMLGYLFLPALFG